MERKIKQIKEDAEIHDETLEMMSDALDKCQKNPEDFRTSLQLYFEEMINAKVKDGNDSDSLLSRQHTQNLIEIILYLILKLSTTRVNWMGLVSCTQRPCTNLLW